MNMKFFGDSYDIVKLSLIRWLSCFGEWSVHPMFTKQASATEALAFEALLGARIVSNSVLTCDTDRKEYLSCGHRCGNLFLDPDTGLRLISTSGRHSPNYLFAEELVSIMESRKNFLTLVFDQSLPRGDERTSVRNKMKHLNDNSIFGFAYISHASFFILSHDKELALKARHNILEQSKLPGCRFFP